MFQKNAPFVQSENSHWTENIQDFKKINCSYFFTYIKFLDKFIAVFLLINGVSGIQSIDKI